MLSLILCCEFSLTICNYHSWILCHTNWRKFNCLLLQTCQDFVSSKSEVSIQWCCQLLGWARPVRECGIWDQGHNGLFVWYGEATFFNMAAIRTPLRSLHDFHESRAERCPASSGSLILRCMQWIPWSSGTPDSQKSPADPSFGWCIWYSIQRVSAWGAHRGCSVAVRTWRRYKFTLCRQLDTTSHCFASRTSWNREVAAGPRCRRGPPAESRVDSTAFCNLRGTPRGLSNITWAQGGHQFLVL